jgi:hypothetical protein
MNALRILTTAAAGSLLLAAAPAAAHAADLKSTLTGAAVSARSAGEQAGTAATGVLAETGASGKIQSVKEAVRAGADAVHAGNDLINS